jgi:hypothetical protein
MSDRIHTWKRATWGHVLDEPIDDPREGVGDAAVECRMALSGQPMVQGAGAVITGPDGRPWCRYVVQDGDLSQRGNLQAEFFVTYPDGSMQRVPRTRWISVRVLELIPGEAPPPSPPPMWDAHIAWAIQQIAALYALAGTKVDTAAHDAAIASLEEQIATKADAAAVAAWIADLQAQVDTKASASVVATQQAQITALQVLVAQLEARIAALEDGTGPVDPEPESMALAAYFGPGTQAYLGDQPAVLSFSAPPTPSPFIPAYMGAGMQGYIGGYPASL